MSVGRSECVRTCAFVGVNVCAHGVRGPGLLKAAVLQINIQAPTRFSKEEQGVMGDAGKINRPSSEVERRKARRGEEHRKQHEGKINGRCLRRFSVALAKTGNGFTQRRRRNSTFLGKD